jgi:thiamine biosynthesis lipoprotein
VRDPRSSGVLGTIELASGEAALSSGDYERRYESGGEVYHHIIDPRSGRPARGAAGTTVVSADPVLGNAGATALMVAGAEGFAETVRRLGIDCALLVTPDGRRLTTPCMSRRLRNR